MKQLFLNLPVENITKSQAFYEALGFTVNPIFTDEDQKCMVWSEHIYVMLQSKAFTEKHGTKPLANLHSYAGPSFTLPLENPTDVDRLAEIALAQGAKEPNPQVQLEFMHLRTIEDSDGHTWGLLYLNMEKFVPLR